MQRELRFASVGTSSIMDVMQEAMSLTPGVSCKVVYSRDLQRGTDYAGKIGVPEADDDFERVCRREDIDAVYIASPNVFHVEQALTALSCGKHVVVEKPADVTAAGVDALAKEAKKNHVYFFEAITTIFMPNYLACKDLMPRLGKIHTVDIRYGKYSSKMDAYLRGENPNIFNPAMKTGALNDMGIYCIHMAVDLFGEPVAVRYVPVYGKNGIDLEGILYVDWDGLSGVLKTAKNREIGRGCRIAGENGFFEEDGQINVFETCTARIGEEEIPIRYQNGENRMLYELARFRDAINSRDEAFFERMIRQSRMASSVLEEAHKQIDQ